MKNHSLVCTYVDDVYVYVMVYGTEHIHDVSVYVMGVKGLFPRVQDFFLLSKDDITLPLIIVFLIFFFTISFLPPGHFGMTLAVFDVAEG